MSGPTKIREGQAVDADFLSEAEAASTTSPSGASLIGVEDSAGNFAGTNVETVLAEFGSTTSPSGASLIGVEDTGNYFTGTDVEAVLQELGAEAPTISSGAGAPSSTPTKVGDIYVDTTNDDPYTAVGTSSSADWSLGGGGGVSSPASYTHTETPASTSWTVNHGLGSKPFIQVYDGSDQIVNPTSITHDSNNQATITFTVAQSGSAICLSVGALNASGTYTHTETPASASWTVAHSLGKKPIIEIRDSSGNVILPMNTKHDSVNQATITFSSAIAGEAFCLVSGIIASSVVGRYKHTEGSAAATWNITHNLGSEPLVQYYDASGDRIYPNTENITTTTATATFSPSVAGFAIAIA